MATYSELFDLRANSALKNKVSVACVIAADAIRQEDSGTTNHSDRLIWAKAVFANPSQESERMLWAILAQNNSLTVAQITGASDAAILTAVQAAINIFATGS